MKKLKTFWYVFKRSLTEPEYYADVLKSSFSFSLKYLFFLLFLILLIKGIFFSVALSTLFPQLPQIQKQTKTTLKEFYPDELVLTINNGTLRTNVDEPYTIPFPKSLNVKDMSFAVIDTKATVEDFTNSKTLLFVTKNAIAYPDSNSSSGFRVQPLSDMKGYAVINRQTYDKILTVILPYVNYAPNLLIGIIVFMLVPFPLVGGILYFSWILVLLFFLTALSYIMARLIKKPTSYITLYHLGIHGITFSILFDFFKGFFGITIPFTFVMPFLIWMLIVLNNMKITYGRSSRTHRSTK